MNCGLITHPLAQLKLTDEKYIRFQQILKKMKYYRRYGITESNSWEFYILVDEFQPLKEYVERVYQKKLGKALNAWFQNYC